MVPPATEFKRAQIARINQTQARTAFRDPGRDRRWQCHCVGTDRRLALGLTDQIDDGKPASCG